MGNQRVTGDLITRNFPECGTVGLCFCNAVILLSVLLQDSWQGVWDPLDYPCSIKVLSHPPIKAEGWHLLGAL